MEAHLKFGEHVNSRTNCCGMVDGSKAAGEQQGNEKLQPYGRPVYNKVSPSMLDALLKEYSTLIKIAHSSIEKLRPALIKYSMTIGLAGKDGVILMLQGVDEKKHLEIEIGSILLECSSKQSVVKMCLESGRPCSILREEHDEGSLEKLSRFAAPIYDSTGIVYAVLFACIPAEFSDRNVLGMLLLAAGGIEKEWILSSQNHEMQLIINTLSHFDDEIAHAASMLSHEVRNSLATISSYIQLLELMQILEHQRAEKVLDEINRVNKLLDGFRTLARPMQFRFNHHSISKILRNTVETMRAKAQMQNVEIDLVLGEGDLMAYGDKDALCQVFVNLILNAIQAMERGGRLTVKVETKNSETVVIEFTDTGIGIPAYDLPNIFKAFFTTKKTGSGLGLPLCQNIIKSHGGEIKVDSIVGAGTTFTIELPLHR